MLAGIATAKDAVDVIAFAEAARVWAQQARLGTSAVNHATVIKMRAERRLADAVDEGQKAGQIAVKGQHSSSPSEDDKRPVSIADIGITNPGRLAEAREIRDNYSDDDLIGLQHQADEADEVLSRKELIRKGKAAAAAADRARRAAERAAAPPEVATGLRLAYADPPYLGQGHLYPEHPDARDWDDPATHRALITQLQDEYPDGWALSASSPSLGVLLPMCPDDYRIGAWVKPFAAFKANVRVAYTWEPVIWRGGRLSSRDGAPVGRDHLSQAIMMQAGLTGAKPPEFCRWVAMLLGYDPARDALEDLFPGTGIMGDVLEEMRA